VDTRLLLFLALEYSQSTIDDTDLSVTGFADLSLQQQQPLQLTEKTLFSQLQDAVVVAAGPPDYLHTLPWQLLLIHKRWQTKVHNYQFWEIPPVLWRSHTTHEDLR
jgi:hypothetical protein